MVQRQTLAKEVSLDGIGLHTGTQVRIRLIPAQPGTGVVFVRKDLGGVRIPATLDHTGAAFYATVLQQGQARVSTIEHLMAALYALQIDDVEIELDADELPILDGSARPFVDALARAGCVELPMERQYMTLVRPIVVSREDKRIAAYPSNQFRITYAIDFEHPVLGYQELSVSLWERDAFAQKLASARTFTFELEVEKLRSMGLARGGSLDNAVVLGKNDVLNAELRYDDEFVRHKMLDLTGDLALLGRPLRAHIVAYRAGHDLHTQLARTIWDASDCWYLAPWSTSSRPLDAAAGA